MHAFVGILHLDICVRAMCQVCGVCRQLPISRKGLCVHDRQSGDDAVLSADEMLRGRARGRSAGACTKKKILRLSFHPRDLRLRRHRQPVREGKFFRRTRYVCIYIIIYHIRRIILYYILVYLIYLRGIHRNLVRAHSQRKHLPVSIVCSRAARFVPDAHKSFLCAAGSYAHLFRVVCANSDSIRRTVRTIGTQYTRAIGIVGKMIGKILVGKLLKWLQTNRVPTVLVHLSYYWAASEALPSTVFPTLPWEEHLFKPIKVSIHSYFYFIYYLQSIISSKNVIWAVFWTICILLVLNDFLCVSL